MIDYVEIKVKAGDGGNGAVSFRREKYVEKGGPDGGDGGNGGSVYFRPTEGESTLMDFRTKKEIKALDGEKGMRRKMYGSKSEDLIVPVPVGTLVYEYVTNLETGEEEKLLVCDLNTPGEDVLIAKGGRGGKGNFKFRSSRNQTPYQYTPGTPGQEKRLALELKLLADVGLLGFPNAGKSTLINQITNSNSKIAAYEFTTLSPELGVCKLIDGSTVTIADIPGIIEGASEGKGLGDQFLKHIERTRLLAHLIDPMTDESGVMIDFSDLDVLKKNCWHKYQIIRKELKNYSKRLIEKPEVVLINKTDVTEIKEALPELLKFFKTKKIKSVMGISAATGGNMDGFKQFLLDTLKVLPKEDFYTVTPTKVFTVSTLPNKRLVYKDEVKVLE